MSKSSNTAWIEQYYGRDNQPNSRQLSRKVHFRDDEGRTYAAAVKNDQILQNDRFKMRKDDTGRKECIVDQYGRITLYVRLVYGAESWFSDKAIGKPLLLRRIDAEDCAYEVILYNAFRYGQKRCAGTVVVQGLDPWLCNRLLNKGT